MGRFLARRLLAAVLLLLGITLVTFVLTNVVPGDPAAANLGQRAIDDPEAVAAFNHRYGLDKPLPVQYFTLPPQPRPGRPRRLAAEPATGPRGPRRVRPGDVRAGRHGDRHLDGHRRRAGDARRLPPRPARRLDPARRLAARRVDPGVLAVAHRAVRPDVPLAGVSRIRPASSRRDPPRPRDGHVHRRRPARR